MELLVFIIGIMVVLGLFDLTALRTGADSRVLSTDRTPRQEL